MPGSIETARPDDDADDAQWSSAFLLNHPAGAGETRRALGVLLVSALVFCLLAPIAKRQLPAVPAFMPMYEAALVLLDLVTATLLFGQYRILRSPPLLVLASGYVFSLVITIGHALSFPGLFAPRGLLGGGAQSTAWIYMFWHGGFPLFVLGYVALRHAGQWKYRITSAAAPAGAALLAAGLVALATADTPLLPAIMIGNRYSPAMLGTVGTVVSLCLLAFFSLWRLRRLQAHSLLDLWLMVVLGAWVFDIGLSAMFNGGRWDLGFYAGRIFGLLACSVVLLELLRENSILYGRLLQQHGEQRRQARQLLIAHDAAQAAAEAKSQFLASMGHEIRTPMNAIIGLTQLVLETSLQPRQREYLTRAQTSSKALLGLLNNILDYSKIEAGKVAIEHEEISVEELIENVGHLFSARIEESGLELLFEIDEEIPQRVLGDAMRLSQVLNNLVGNAIKFTTQGEIVVGARLVSRDEAGCRIAFSVRDSGIGMSEAETARLFQAFQQASSTTARRHGGTGLGLAICRRLVEMMGGEIGVQSTPGQGSSFSFTAQFAAADSARTAERIDLHRIQGMRALVLDSQPTARLILQQMLHSWRFQAGLAAFPDDALLKLRRAQRASPYELLVLDWKTAGGDFLAQALPYLGGNATFGAKPLLVVVMVSLQAREQAIELLAEYPNVQLVLKPITPSRLFEAIVKLQHGEEPPAVAEGARRAQLPELLRPLRGARVLLVEDNLVNQQVATAFLEVAGLLVTVANNGLEAVDQVRTAHFDVVLMDMQMPDMDGLQATRVIRGLPWSAGLMPIIAMTAAARAEDVQECLAAGMNAHVSKPIDPRQLARTLLEWVRPPAAGSGSVPAHRS